MFIKLQIPQSPVSGNVCDHIRPCEYAWLLRGGPFQPCPSLPHCYVHHWTQTLGRTASVLVVPPSAMGLKISHQVSFIPHTGTYKHSGTCKYTSIKVRSEKAQVTWKLQIHYWQKNLLLHLHSHAECFFFIK